jgi:outer membrane immunogenic protein
MRWRWCAVSLMWAAVIGLAVGPVRSADLPVAPPTLAVAPVASAPAAIFSWTGFYIGGHLGVGLDRSTWSDPLTGANNMFMSGAGFLGGAQAGANWQFNRLVLGVEGDFGYAGLTGSGADSLGNAIGTNTNWTSTVAGRIGGAFDRLLIYGKGGVAFAREQNTFIDIAGNSASNVLTRTGWTGGIGLEYGISANWSAKVEYDYLNFGAQALNFTTATTPAYSTNAALNAHEVKAGVNFRFGGP